MKDLYSFRSTISLLEMFFTPLIFSCYPQLNCSFIFRIIVLFVLTLMLCQVVFFWPVDMLIIFLLLMEKQSDLLHKDNSQKMIVKIHFDPHESILLSLIYYWYFSILKGQYWRMVVFDCWEVCDRSPITKSRSSFINKPI